MTRNKKDILVFNSIESFVDHAVEKWIELSEKAIHEKGHFSVALSGGTSPVPLYKKLAETKGLQWSKTQVFLVDERFVPYESGENNFQMINTTLLCHVAIPANNVHYISTVERTPKDAAKRYEKDLLSYAKKTKALIPRFDLVFLGIGDDGHTASLFPASPALKEKQHLARAVTSPHKDTKERITLTFPVINNAKNIIFLIIGSSKAAAAKEVLESKACKLPAAMVKPEGDSVLFMLDQEAASLLSGKR